MKGKITAEIMGILPVPIKDTAIIDFGENSNVFGRVCDAHYYFMEKFNVEFGQVHCVGCEYLDTK